MKDGLGITLTLIVLAWMTFFYQGNVDYTTRHQAVGNIVYRYAQTAGKKGELNDTIYDDLKNKLSIYGDFNIEILAEKFEDSSVVELYNNDVLNYDLRDNDYDILTIYVESKNEHWLDKVMQLPPFGQADSSKTNYKITAKSSVYVQ